MISRRATERINKYEITQRPVFAFLALSAVQIGTLIHRIDGGVSRPPVHSSGLARSCLIVVMWPIIRI